ncbi:Acriflavin resistance plasma membrane protein (plasmid) [Roseomonas mucosa]|uniref:Cation efflux system protein CzcA n=3 Tax=Roseomonas mucosa TaxID=207340 RepID=A0A379PND0_9PROT|nr:MULTISPECIES: efflux RND transporter permease subunit [Roseomonas]MBS5904697.1 efflux RND transporter permease subunit [Acetobacteraceae bacterium]MDT8291603.1 efflux RND transporter permease subunit [Roseomonas mucosa]MDT8315565.1 efflux RND transporter permease subunit [Roseomonas mucosa]MDT8352196.1 efflux RND transporter permease subunit [Roseomonas mucosa]MDT8362268.1 efflux RND transporter permease subunit [Roseomonas mucosa]
MKPFNLSEWALNNRSIVVYLMIVAVLAGTLSFLRLGRAEDPVFTIRTMIVQANWPGASMKDTLNQVTERLERRLQETPNLNRLRSFTQPGQSLIYVELLGSTPGAKVADTWYQVRKYIGDIRHTLPPGIQGPFFNDDFGDTFGIVYGFTADGFTHRELRDHVEEMRSELLKVPDVSRIEFIGAQDERVFIEFSMEKLAGLGIDRNALIAALQAQNLISPAGTIEGGQERLLLRVSGSFESEDDIRATNFSMGNRILRLSDVAEVHRGYADPPQPMFRANGREAIGLGISMRDGGDVLQLGRNIDAAARRVMADMPVGIEMHSVAEQPRTVELAIADFMDSLWQSIAIILVASFVSLGLRAGAIVALAIPLTLAIVFPIMQVAGIDLQRVSLGALIIALALMVDDAMTTVDAMMNRLAAGDSKEAAGTYAFRALAFSMLAGTLVTIAGFVPIGFARSSAGEYTFSIFAVVTIALLVSWLVAVIFAPLLGVLILRPPKPGTSNEPGRLVRIYRSFLGGAIRWRWLTIAATVGLFALSVFGMRFVSQQFFPPSDRYELMVDLTLPQNASIHATDATAARLEAILAKDADVERWSTNVGRGAIRFYLPLDVQPPNNFFAQLVVITKGLQSRDRLETRLEQLLPEQFPDVVGRVYPLELGPPVGWPIQYRVSGDDPDKVRDLAMNLAKVVAAHPSTRGTSFDWMEPARQLRVRVDQDEARRLGLSSAAVASALNAAISGTTVTQMRDGIYLINVVVRAVEAERMSVDALRTLQIPIPGGRTVSLSQFATFDYDQEYPIIMRRNRVPTLTVQAYLPRGVLPNDVVDDLEPGIAAAVAALPPGYRIETGGIVEESADSLASVKAVVPMMLFIMLTVLIFHLKSFSRLLIVLSVVPLGLIGVAAALLLSSSPLGFVAILGVLSLMGMIAKNAVILVTQIEAERKAGRSVTEAALEASTSRFRPIMLTAVSTVLGMIPITPTVFWGPMAFAIMGGLLGATILTLIFLPVLYVTCFEGRVAARPG